MRRLWLLIAFPAVMSCVFPDYRLPSESLASVVGGAASGGIDADGGAMDAAGSPSAGAPEGGAAGQPAVPEGGVGGVPDAPAPINLARGRDATASSQQSGREVPMGNDGDDGSRWSAANDRFPQWRRVDLGEVRLLDSFTVHWEHGNVEYRYTVETSDVDELYTPRVTQALTGLLQSAPFPAGVQARYVRITVTGSSPRGWATFYELNVNGF